MYGPFRIALYRFLHAGKLRLSWLVMAYVDYFIPSDDPISDYDRYDYYRTLDAQKEQNETEETEEWEVKENWSEICDRF